MTRSRAVPALRWLMALLAFGWLLAGCEGKPPPECEDDDPDRPTFAASGDGGSCSIPPCEDCGTGSGDPHIRTYDRLRYDYQGVAEVVAARAPDGSFEVQWRTRPRGRFVSSIGAVAMEIGGTRITVDGGNKLLRVDGNVVDLETLQSTHYPASGLTVHHVDNWIIVVGPGDAGAVHMSLSKGMTVLVQPPDDFRGSMEGLLGDGDGHGGEDDRAQLPDDADNFHHILGEMWRVDDATSLFDYDYGFGPDDYWDPEFPYDRPPRLNNFSEEDRQAAADECRAAGVVDEDALADCIYDLLVTGDAAFVQDALLLQARTTEPLISRRPTTARTTKEAASGVGQTITGDITRIGERSRYDLELKEGQIIYLAGDPDDNCEARLTRYRVLGPNGRGFSSENDACNDIGRLTAGPAGTYQVLIRGNSDTGTGPYNITIHDVPPDRTGRVGVGDTITGDITRIGERSRYDLELKEGQIIYLAGDPDDNCEARLTRYRVLGPNGRGFSSENDACNDIGRLTAGPAGTYQVLIRGNSDTGTGPYNITIHDVPPDRTGRVGVGDTITGDITRIGERSRYDLELKEGQIIYLAGDPDDNCEARLTRYRVLGPNGRGFSSENDACNDIGRLTAGPAGTYQVLIRGNSDTGTGPYNITIHDVPPDRTGRVGVGDTITGDITRIGERSRYDLELKEGQIIYLAGDPDDNCEARLTRYRVLGPNGRGFSSENDACKNIGRLTAGPAGTYQVLIRGNSDTGTGSYNITIRDE